MHAFVVAIARAALALAMVTPASAGAAPDAKGVKVGTNLFGTEDYGLDGSSATNPTSGGLTFGAFVTWRYAAAFAVQPEALVSRKVLFTEACPSGACMKVSDIELWYLELPFLLRLDLLPGERGKFHLDLGPELVIPLGGGVKNAMTGEFQAFDEGIRASDDLLPVNVGIVVGVGLEIGAGAGRITIDARYKRWLIPVLPGDNSGDRASTHQLVALIGYAFP